ncbi:ATP-dependent DNA helicase RecQ [Geofilum rubicundum JCM 15548]|uniref:DNA 3'-5' helicase n=1 Tax=Geofilum rubicundum JCM 15548 TaxID=1236989 RepID=A0A0E9LUS6_9BACT|nr:ATP-dependent DNA helicase RecQ [Geofilum rubicundum JCM 15548]
MTKHIDLNAYLKQHFGFDTFKGNQDEIIRNVLAGNDTFVLMPTGGGKSLCYQLPAMILEGTAIIISPLIALMKNQVDAMRNFSEDDGVAHFLNSSLTKSAIMQVKEDVMAGKTKLLYVAPESLTKEENILFLKQVKISFYAVDEAHCISEWGHDFRPEYRRIRPIINEIGEAPVIALTATATPKVQHDIQKTMGMLKAHVFKSSFNRPNLYYEVRPKVNASKEIIRILKENAGKSTIIYCLSRKKVEELAEMLVVNGLKALAYHAGMDASTDRVIRISFCMRRSISLWPPLLLEWVLISPMYALLCTTISQKVWKAITRKPVAPVAMAVKDVASLFIAIKTFRSSKNSCRVNLWRNRKLVSNCCLKRWLMPRPPCVEENCSCTILASHFMRIIVTPVITACIPKSSLKARNP